MLGEKYFEEYYKTYGLKTCSLRFFNVYGSRQDSSDYGFVTGMFIQKVLNNEEPIIFGDGTQTRDFVYIKDNIRATIKAMETDKTNGQAINIGNGKSITILDLANTIIRLTGKDNLKSTFKPSRLDIKHRCPEVTKMKELIGYTPKYSLDEGLKDTIEYYKTKQE